MTKEKIISDSEGKEKYKVSVGYFIEKLKIEDINSQSSINFPTSLLNEMKEHDILKESDKINQILSEDKVNAYELDESFTFQLNKGITDLLKIDGENCGFFVVQGNGIKCQLRPANYAKVGNEIDDDLNYDWLSIFMSLCVSGGELKFYCDSSTKTFTIDYDSKLDEAISKALSDKMVEEIIVENICEEQKSVDKKPLQLILFGAPGTGKSYNISSIISDHSETAFESNSDVDEKPNIFRCTMFPDYSYHDFIGTVMPIVDKENFVKYDFVPGVFTNALNYAFRNPNEYTYLIIEEMSRANIASVFGDVFQILDREESGVSSYRINNDLIAKELNRNLFSLDDGVHKNVKIYLPKNFSIIGTVNSNDQNVFVMDTAFKRRFDFKYVSTDPIKSLKGENLNDFKFKMNNSEKEWINFYCKINEFILNDAELSEDKQIGQFFIKGNISEEERAFSENTDKVKSKLLNYLWMDVNPTIFNGKKIFKDNYRSFIELYNAFENENVFSFEFDGE